jgi:hypothetical protein
MTCHFTKPLVAMKVITSAKVTKNSEKFTDPIILRGECPLEISVAVTIGPHPPPPIASHAPPTRPKCLVDGSSVTLSDPVRVFNRIRTSMSKR